MVPESTLTCPQSNRLCSRSSPVYRPLYQPLCDGAM